jgi:hypothetical protein
MLDAIGAGTQKQLGGDKDWADRWADSDECEQIKREIQEINREALKHEEEHDPEADKEYSTGFMRQLMIVSERTLTAFYRNPDYGQPPPSLFHLRAMKLMLLVQALLGSLIVRFVCGTLI